MQDTTALITPSPAQLSWSSVLSTLSQKMLSQPREELLAYVTQILVPLLNVGACSIWLRDPGTQELVLRHAQGRPVPANRLSRESFLGRALNSPVPIYVANIQQEPIFRYPDYAKSQGWMSTLVVPIRAADSTPLGLICMYSVHEERQFTEQERSLAMVFANHVAIILQQATLLAEKERQVEISASLQRVSHALATAKDFHALLQPIVTEAMHLVHATGAILYLRDEHARENVVKAVAGIADKVQGMRASYEGSLSGWVAMHNQPALCGQDDDRVDRRIAGRMGLQGNVAAVPLAWEERVIGTLVALDKHGGKVDFDHDDITVLRTLATQATIALEKAQLYEDIERRAKQQRIINDILTASVSSQDIETLLEEAARRMHAEFGYKVALSLIEQGELVFKRTIFYGGTIRRDGPILKLEEGITGQAARTGQPVVVPDVRHTPYPYKEDHPNTRSEIAVPLIARDGQAIGVFDSESMEVNAFSTDDVQLFQSIAAGITLAIENVQRLKEHAALRMIADVVSQVHALPDILDNVVPTVVPLFQASACSLYLADAQGQHLTLTRHHGLPPSLVTKMGILQKGKGIAGTAFEECRPIVVHDLVNDPRVQGLVTPDDGLHSMMSVPIKANAGILGVLNVANVSARSFTDHDVELLEIVSTQLGRAIEKAQLSEQYRRLYQDASDMMFTVDEEARIIDANTQALEMTGYRQAGLLHQPLTTLMASPDMRSEGLKRVQEVFAGAKPTLLSFEIRSKTKPTLWVEESLNAIRDHIGQCVAVEVIWRDITDRRRTAAFAEQRNRQLNTSLELSRIATDAAAHNDLLSQVASGTLSLLESQRCVVYLYTDDQKQMDILTFPSAQATAQMHTKPLCDTETLIRQALTSRQGDMLNDIPRLSQPPHIPRTFGEAVQHAMLMPIKSSDSVFGVISVVRNVVDSLPYHSSDKEYLELLANILSLDLEHKRLAQLETTQQAALKTLEHVSVLGGFLAHKVPSVLGPIDWTAQRLATLVQPTGGEAQLLMESLLDSGRKATRLIAQCRILGKPLSQAPEQVPFASLVQTTLQQMYIPVSIHVLRGPLELPVVKANASLLAEVIEGMLQNAVDAMPDDGELSISGQSSHGMARLQIRDTGHGIAPEHRQHLFATPFFTTKNDYSHGTRSGFGLWLSRLYLRSIGGDIDFAPASPTGTIFSLTLPIAPTLPAHEPPLRLREPQGNGATTDLPPVAPSGVANVLIVEDESNWQGRLSLPFLTQGWHVHRASSYKEALHLIEQHAFAAFVIDVRLVHYDAGNVDGLRVVEHLRSRGRIGPVLILSVWETSLRQAHDRFAHWENITTCDKADNARLDAEITALAAQGSPCNPQVNG